MVFFLYLFVASCVSCLKQLFLSAWVCEFCYTVLVVSISSVGCLERLAIAHPVWVPGLRIDPLRLLAGCRKRWLNQASLNLRGLIWFLMMDWSERGNLRKRGPLWELFRRNSALCSWQANQSSVQRKKKPPCALRKHLRKQKKAPYNS